MNNNQGERKRSPLIQTKMKDFILVLCILVGGLWWCYAILDLMFFHTWVGLMGIWAGAVMFLLGWSVISESEEYEIE